MVRAAIRDVETPALLLDTAKLDRNLARMRARARELGTAIRPHVKTAKSIDVVRRALVGEPGGITVSTLREADYFLDHGIRDIVYAVGIAPGKLDHVIALTRRGAALALVLDSVAAVQAVSHAAVAAGLSIPVLIELDVDGHRAGVTPDGPELLEIAQAVAAAPAVELRGVLTHAGESYNCRGPDALRAMAERERAGAVGAAERIRKLGLRVPVVSVGSTPTVTFAENLSGVTEVRVGVYMFGDLVMSGLGVCAVEDIALSVLVSVIGHQPAKGWVITDGGWMALSRDHGTASQPVDQSFGVVCDVAGQPLREDLIVCSTNQEHGVIARRNGGALNPAEFPIGTMFRILPNHACATAAQHTKYLVVDAERPEILDEWPRLNGW